ncbi:hypothetical protein HMPREF9466_00001 [Fusobacterium necrophorum subsp. funduliforme 1_1_36S]|nr:hypothetical protein HMPREF9466_00001 [Fusobacterium necrophorum subsp. funduliforme 1_1_36S]
MKKAAAICNMEAETIQEDVAKAIIQAADEIISGKFRDQFITDVIQGGAGTSMNMNMNEVIANRANELLGGALGTYDKVHPNDHVNFGQSTNDVVPTSGKLTIQFLLRDLLKNLEDLYSTFQSKATQYDHIIKMGRTHLQDAVPIRVGQEFRAFFRPCKTGYRTFKISHV